MTLTCQAYKRAIERAVAKRRAADGGAHVLDIGCGSGVLSLLAARAGADSVVACDIHSSLCDVARKVGTVQTHRWHTPCLFHLLCPCMCRV